MHHFFDSSRAQHYRSRPDGPIKKAEFVPTPATYEASWGPQEMHGPHFKISLDTEPPYGSEAIRFLSEHIYIESEGGWQKSAEIEAYQVTADDAPLKVTTIIDGKQETTNTALEGDWIVRWPQGEVGVLRDKRFRQVYDV